MAQSATLGMGHTLRGRQFISWVTAVRPLCITFQMCGVISLLCLPPTLSGIMNHDLQLASDAAQIFLAENPANKESDHGF